ncbi:MAG: chromate transporter [Treponemataceae bacterium]|nr:chromate transporter [Treponemataceae bacterium]
MEKNTFKNKKNSFSLLSKLFLTFFKIGAVTFGGGMAMLPILEREVVDKNKWASRDDLSDYYAISQITPGIIAVNVATFIGFNLAGILGGIIATFGVVTPSVIIITLISFFIESVSHLEWVQSALSGINVAVCALLASALFKFIKSGVKACNIFLALALMIISFVLIAFLHVPSALVIIAGAVIGVLIYVFQKHRSEMKKSGEDEK